MADNNSEFAEQTSGCLMEGKVPSPTQGHGGFLSRGCEALRAGGAVEGEQRDGEAFGAMMATGFMGVQALGRI